LTAPTTKASDIINRACDLFGYKDATETLSAGEQTAFLAVLNDMLDHWNTQRLYIVNVGEVVQTVSGLPITIGPGATISIVRPIQLEDGSFIRSNGVDYPIHWISQDAYNALAVKGVPGVLSYSGYYQQAVPVGSLYLWPYPSTPVELHLQVQTQLTQFADFGTTSYNLAQSYRKALQYSLAEELAAGKRDLPASVIRIAAAARRAIKRVNVQPLDQSLSAGGSMSPKAAFIAGL